MLHTYYILSTVVLRIGSEKKDVPGWYATIIPNDSPLLSESVKNNKKTPNGLTIDVAPSTVDYE